MSDKCEWRFRRYRTDQYGNRRLMAQGARVHAETEQEAAEKAKALFADCPRDELVLRETQERQA